MRARQYLAALAAAVMLAGCGQTGTSSSSGASSGQQALRTGLAVQSKAEDGEMHTVAAAVWLDQEGRIQRAVVDEFEGQLASGEDGKNTWPEDLRTKRQKGADYPLDKVSSIGRSWAQQADAFCRTPEGDDRQPGAGGADRRGRLCPGSRPFGGLYHQNRRLPGGCGSRLRGRHGLMVCPS